MNSGCVDSLIETSAQIDEGSDVVTRLKNSVHAQTTVCELSTVSNQGGEMTEQR